MPANVNSVVDAASSLVQAAQGGFELGASQNAYSAFSNALNLAGTFAGTGPWATGINIAATTNNTITAVSAYSQGTLQPSDVLEVTSGALSLVAAAAAISGAPITLSAIVLAGTIGIIAGPGQLRDSFNEYATALGEKLSSGLFGSTPFNAAELSREVGGTAGEGQSVVFHQYDINGGEMVTIEFVDRFGISHGEYGKVTGVARTGVVTATGTFWSVIDSDGDITRSYFEPAAPSQYDFTMPLPAESWTKGLTGASDRVEGGEWGWGAGSGNTIDYVRNIASAAGIGYGALASAFDLTSLSGQFFDELNWFNQSQDFYQQIWDSGGNADIEADYHLTHIEQLQAKLGETEEYPEIAEDVAHGIASPIVIDLDGNGLHTVSLDTSQVQFDTTGDGIQERTGWIESGDAFLAIDRNGNGCIDDVNEMFGGMSRGVGFAELAALDQNEDRMISAGEADAAGLLLWQDVNSNGKTEDGELRSASARITSIALDYQSVDLSDNGNLIGELSEALSNTGPLAVGDIYFRYHRLPSDTTSMLISSMAQFNLPQQGALHVEQHVTDVAICLQPQYGISAS